MLFYFHCGSLKCSITPLSSKYQSSTDNWLQLACVSQVVSPRLHHTSYSIFFLFYQCPIISSTNHSWSSMTPKCRAQAVGDLEMPNHCMNDEVLAVKCGTLDGSFNPRVALAIPMYSLMSLSLLLISCMILYTLGRAFWLGPLVG
jgi:hypothetical protein